MEVRSKQSRLGDVISFGFIWYQIYKSYRLSDFLLSRIYQVPLSMVALDVWFGWLGCIITHLFPVFQTISKFYNDPQLTISPSQNSPFHYNGPLRYLSIDNEIRKGIIYSARFSLAAIEYCSGFCGKYATSFRRDTYSCSLNKGIRLEPWTRPGSL